MKHEVYEKVVDVRWVSDRVTSVVLFSKEDMLWLICE